MYTDPYAFPTWTNGTFRQPRRRRRKELALIFGGFLLTLGGGLFLLENDQARLRVCQFLPEEFAVAIGIMPAAPEAPSATSAAATENAATQSDSEQTEIAQRQKDTNRPAPPSQQRPRQERPEQESASRPSPPSDTNTLWSERTFAFWNSLNRIMTKEVALRDGSRYGAVANSTHRSRRGRSAEFAIRAIRGLDRRFVDVRVQALAEEIIDWYKDELRTDSDHTSLVATSTPSSAPQRHVRRDVDINRRSELLRGKMSDKYRRPFPSLQ